MTDFGERPDELVNAFKTFDPEGTGYVDSEIISLILTTLGDKLTDAQITELKQEADPGNEGKINYEQFVRSVVFGDL